ncbi:MAG: hypothetical protein NW224_07845 [Leptolyngbyaceae cyanobacterium bins.302]|nr:hypothetical protein [Leptolyngbyaceae cyanobacterium bins.302]
MDLATKDLALAQGITGDRGTRLSQPNGTFQRCMGHPTQPR